MPESETESKLYDLSTSQAFAFADLSRTECSRGESPEISSISQNPFWALFYLISQNRTPTMEEPIEDPPTSAVLLDHCHFSQIIFNNVEKFYVPGGDVMCYYTLTQHFIPRRKDWIGIFRVSGQLSTKWRGSRGEASLSDCAIVDVLCTFCILCLANYKILSWAP